MNYLVKQSISQSKNSFKKSINQWKS